MESDDARHDEALSSRIAALNMLDLSLDHLGLITQPDKESPGEKGTVAHGLAKIVDDIGEGRSDPTIVNLTDSQNCKSYRYRAA